MADVINLKQYRKKLKRERKQREAAGNVIRHGQSKAERRRLGVKRAREDKAQEGKHLERGQPDDEPLSGA